MISLAGCPASKEASKDWREGVLEKGIFSRNQCVEFDITYSNCQEATSRVATLIGVGDLERLTRRFDESEGGAALPEQEDGALPSPCS